MVVLMLCGACRQANKHASGEFCTGLCNRCNIGRCKVAKLLAVLRSMDLPSSLRCVVASLRHCIVASIVDVDMPKEWSRHGRH